MGCGSSSTTAQQPGPTLLCRDSGVKILPGQAAIIRNCPNARLNGERVVCEAYNAALGEWTVKGNRFPLSVGMSLGAQFLELESGSVCGNFKMPVMQQKVGPPQSPEADNLVVAHASEDVQQQCSRMIKIHLASGEAVELAVNHGDTVGDLCRRTADLRDAGWATLLVGSEALDEKLDACSNFRERCFGSAVKFYGASGQAEENAPRTDPEIVRD